MRVAVSRRVQHMIAVAALAFSAGCTDATAPVHLTDLIGTWHLLHLNRTSATTGEITDAMQSGEILTFAMTVAADGTVTTVTTSTTAPPVNGGGTIAASGNRTKLVLDGQSFYGSIVIRGGQLTIDCGAQVGLVDYSRITFIFGR